MRGGVGMKVGICWPLTNLELWQSVLVVGQSGVFVVVAVGAVVALIEGGSCSGQG